jgi:hypothetical protein
MVSRDCSVSADVKISSVSGKLEITHMNIESGKQIPGRMEAKVNDAPAGD